MAYINKKIKNVEIDYARMGNEQGFVIRGGNYYFSYEKVRELLAMACEDVYPNDHYGDAECCLWSSIRSILCYENLKEWDV